MTRKILGCSWFFFCFCKGKKIVKNSAFSWFWGNTSTKTETTTSQHEQKEKEIEEERLKKQQQQRKKTSKTHQKGEKEKKREREDQNQIMTLLSRIDEFEKKEKNCKFRSSVNDWSHFTLWTSRLCKIC